jgi:anaerobic magnesium-protoporphyrin IX monomethyl ester cyclase
VLSEAPWIDYIVRGEGEEILVNLVRALDEGRWTGIAASIRGHRLPTTGPEIVATPAHPPIKDLTIARAPTGGCSSGTSTSTSAQQARGAIPNFARGCPFTCSFCSQWKFWRSYRTRDPEEIRRRDRDAGADHDVGFFILADEEPTINRRSSSRCARS